jgi:signal transduction histidine kinase
VYTLLIPYALGNEQGTSVFLQDGPWGLHWLRPFHLFGMTDLDPIPHAFFWSMFGNVFTFAAFSVSFKGNYRERNYAEMFVDIDQYIQNHENAFVWKGTAYRRDIEKVLRRFLGDDRTRRAMVVFNTKYDVDKDQELADARLVKFAENLLTGHIGTASARILIAGVVKEEKISLPEVLNILEESRQHILVNKKLTETSKQLQALTEQLQVANDKLIKNDLQKNEFLDTVTHELRTPITAIKASGELLFDDDDIPEALRKQFLHNIITESDRLSRLIDKILDLEKFETGKQVIHGQRANFVDTVQHVLDSLQQLIANKSVAIEWQHPSQLWVKYDEERLIQVLQNLLSNALKFCPEQGGRIVIKTHATATDLHVSVHDNGPGIPQGDEQFIFDKFYQSTQQNLKKPVGSGLGLAISKQIIESHGGQIWTEKGVDGACICFSIPGLMDGRI